MFEDSSFSILFTIAIMFFDSSAIVATNQTTGTSRHYCISGCRNSFEAFWFEFLNKQALVDMEFITHMVLGFVAFKIGLEMRLK
ncbi:MAG: hypothetical protein RI572_05975 [Salegentibacter sp.]|uniref:hypothetical protein n=1 Tax=Salegentibacter sp. TaxID=1903072 RepID=UPI0028700A06|nr:hypothetical protein [Salegentibacter sp.]MDR9456941.1 hypothetical protein [Salegentibacter sp.]